MKNYQNPPVEKWGAICRRPALDTAGLNQTIEDIFQSVKLRGDSALIDYAKQFDGAQLNELQVTELEFEEAEKKTSSELKASIQLAAKNIKTFHSSQVRPVEKIETTKGVSCWRKGVPIDSVGLYIPGGSAPLFSTVLMLGIPAQIAKCKQVILCSPSNSDGKIDPSILYAARYVGISSIYKVGGAQAIAAMSMGTSTIPKVNKIFGPGNQYVTKAKEWVSTMGTAIDMPAGPSEVLVIADETAVPAYVAADLLSQAEHGPDSQVLLVSTSAQLINDVEREIGIQVEELPRSDTAVLALQNSVSILFENLQTCMDFSNSYAPEHLIIACNEPTIWAEKVMNAGSVFLGNYSCESAGDYASGTNHTLPTNGFSKSYSGVSVDSFCKYITFQELTSEGLMNLGNAIEIMADAEGLAAHRNAVSIRLKDLKNV